MTTSPLGRWWRASYGGRTWRELAYLLTGLPVVLAGFCAMLLPLAVGLGLAVVVVGLPVVAAALSVAQGFAGLEHRRAGALLRLRIDPPPGDAAPDGRTSRGDSGLTAGLGRADGWRALLYLWLALPLAVLGFTVAVAGWCTGLICVSYPLWYRRQPMGFDSTRLTGGGSVALVAAAGLAALLLAPWLSRAVVRLDRAALGLLAPSRQSRRLAELAASRALAVTSSSETLRRIERDLHDGAQARMVAVTIDLGLAREALRDQPGAGPARELLDFAHANANAAIGELRDLARGIHPPALDHGLGTALSSLVSRTSVPVDLEVDDGARADPAVETIVYFCAAELLANALKHGGAARIGVQVRRRGDGLRLRVRDDGAGGAVPRQGGGLAGLRERVSTVDGTLGIDSPPGGPTVVTVDLPSHA